MKKLIYVPMIHTSADLGSLGDEVSRKTISLIGEDSWKKHKQTIDGFWKAVSNYFDSLDVKNFKIYQDGLAAEGEMGLKIVEEAASKGSKNYEIISKLIKKGAKIVKTEDIALVKKEVDCITKLVKSKSIFGKLVAFLNYRLKKGNLLKERDEFIAKRINETLGKGETGILFIGAYHDIIPKLSKDIVVKQLKEKEKVLEYQKNFYFKSKRKKVEGIAKYLTSQIKMN